MRNFYLFEPALQVASIQDLERGIENLNIILVNKDEDMDFFICNDTIWECNTSHGRIYDLFSGVINEELRRIVPYVFGTFNRQQNTYTNSSQFDADFPNDCNGFTGFNFGHTHIHIDKQIFNYNTYNVFVSKCLKYGVVNDTEELRKNLAILYPKFFFEERALQETLEWKNLNAGLYDRLLDLFDDIPINPFRGGIGETEVLRHMNGVASKRINQAHRVTYKFNNNAIRILACNGHYN